MGVYHTAGISVSENTGEVHIVAGETAPCPCSRLTTIVSVQIGEQHGTHINQRVIAGENCRSCEATEKAWVEEPLPKGLEMGSVSLTFNS